MPAARTLDLVIAGRDGGYAVAAVNIVDELSARAVIAAAETVDAPVILQTSVKTLRTTGTALVRAVVRTLADAARVPVALHLDHCPQREVITEALDAGWSSVLFDASDRAYEQAYKETAEVVQEAHEAGAAVECEIENITGVEDDVGSDEVVEPYPVEQLVAFAEETGSDLLAPALGTAHGVYKTAPRLRPDRARALRELTDLPLVLHGGTGLTAEDFAGFIRAGVSKINVSTALKLSYMRSCAAHLSEAERTGKYEPVKMFEHVFTSVRDEIAAHLAMFGCAGKAPAVQVRA
jgi:ketose-bisphosphate aldolase